MRLAQVSKAGVVGIAVLLCVAPAIAQQIHYFPDFSSGTSNLQLIDSHIVTWNSQQVLRLTDGYPGIGSTHPESSAAWFKIHQPVNVGFTVYFSFQIHTAGICCTPGDGLAFVLQNGTTDATYGAVGSGVTAHGVGNGGIGYAGILNSLAIEYDTVANAWDPSSNHVAVQSCGSHTNGPVHDPGTYTIGNNHNVTSCLAGPLTGTGAAISSNIPHLGVNCGVSSCADGAVHWSVIEYTPPATVNGLGTLKVYVDPQLINGTHTPVNSAVPAINIPYNINGAYSNTGITLAGGTSAWVGFTASQTNMPQAQDILSWEFTPHTPTQVTQVIPPGTMTADYVFGGHDMGVKYFDSFVNDPNDPYLMTVVATPVARSVFYQSRLLHTPFINEQCLVYLQTGGNCIVYSVTCARQSNPNVTVPCPTANFCTTLGDTVNCITFSTSFYTSDPITTKNADYLKADPIGTNNWTSIFVSYDPNTFDGRTTGTGGSSSDFVATFALGTKP